MNKLTMNVAELSEQLGLSLPSTYTLIKREDFPALHIGRRIVIPVAAFENWLITASNQLEQK